MEWSEVAGYIVLTLAIGYGAYWVVFVDHEGRSAHTMKVRDMDHGERMDRWGRVVDKARELGSNDE